MTSGDLGYRQGSFMKQGSGNRMISDAGEEDARRRRLRWLRWVVILLVIIGLGFLTRVSGLVTTGTGVLLVIVSLLLLTMVWSIGSNRRRQRRWRRDGILFEPQLPRPIASISEEYEWQLPSHPLIRGPLAIALIALLYWVLVIHGMQLPGGWLVGTAVLTLVNLWVWREPLLVAYIVALGLAVLALIGWVVQTLPQMGIIAVVLLISAAVIALWMKVRQGQSKDSSSE